MAIDFQGLLFFWRDIGLFNVILPFFLVFTIVFAILQKIKLLGDKKNVNVIIAVIIGLLVVQSDYIVLVINNFLPNVALILVILVMFLVAAGLLFTGKDDEEWKGFTSAAAAIIAFLGVLWALAFDSFAQQLRLPYWLQLTDQGKATLIVIGTIIVVIWIVTRETSGNQGGGQKFTLFKQ